MEAWQKLLDKYERIVFSVPRRYGLSVDDAADVTQLTFTILVENMDKLPEDSRLGGWLTTVARRHTWNQGLSKLGELCRNLLFALYLDPEQPSYAQVATRLNMAVGSVGPTRIRCLERLRRAMDA